MKLASMVLVLGSLLLTEGALAQEAVYAAPAPAAGAPVHHHGASIIKDTSDHVRPMTASALLYIPWFRGIGIGLKLGFEIPVAPQGFIPKLNDSISIEPAFSIAYSSYYSYDNTSTTNYVAAVGGLWSFWLRNDLRVYGALNLGVNVYSFHYDNGYRSRLGGNDVDPYIEVAGGVFWKVAERVAIRGEVGWYGPRGGVSFLL